MDASAQSAAGRGVRRLKWAPANLLVYSDSSGAVALWFATNQRAVVEGTSVQQQLMASFVPAEVEIWVELTRQLLALDAPPNPGDTSSIVASGVLQATDGTILVASRRRKRSSLDDEIRLLLSPKDLEKRLLLELEAREVVPLLEAMGGIAAGSTYTPAPPPDTTAKREERAARLREEHRNPPHYPPHLQLRQVEGEVWMRFVIDETGKVEVPTIETFLSDDPDFERSVRSWMGRARYHPHTVAGVPKRQRVFQRFVFGFAR